MSFIPIVDVLNCMLYVCKEWRSVLRERPHAWSPNADLRLCEEMPFYAGCPLQNFRKLTLSTEQCTSDLGSYSGVVAVDVCDRDHYAELTNIAFNHPREWAAPFGLKHLTLLPLKHLDLSEVKNITDEGLAHLSTMQLEFFSLSSACVTDAGLTHLAALPLRHLVLSCDNITDMEILSSLPLVYLDLSGCKNLTHLSSFPLLQHLELKNCINITDACLEGLSSRSLQYLGLEWCKNISDVGLAHLSSMPLVHLNLNRNDWETFTDAGLVHLSSMPLRHLELSGCWKVTDAGLAKLSSLPLEYLDLSFCMNVMSSGVAHLSSMPLVHLDLSHCHEVTNAGLVHILKPSLRALFLKGCSKVKPKNLPSFAHLKIHC